MPNIKPVSDLRSYNEVLREVTVGEPVYLTKNGRGRYVLMDIEEFEKSKAALRLLRDLAKGEESAKQNGFIPMDDVIEKLGLADE